MPEISIIVPVYNIRDYIDDCLNSIKFQSFQAFEVLMVNDGSTDGSDAICRRYEEFDARFRLINQANSGQSSARNEGITQAQGKYVICIDGDDIISRYYVEALYEALVKSGCQMATVRGGAQFKDGEAPDLLDRAPRWDDYDILTDKEYQRELLYQVSGTGSPWRMCSLDVAKEFPYPEKMLYEDLATTYKLAHVCPHIAVLKSASLYGYRQREGSTMKGKCSDLNVRSYLRIADQLYRDIAEWYPDLEVAASSRCFSAGRAVYAGLPNGDEENRTLVWNSIRSYAPIVAGDSRARKRERAAAVVALMGKRLFALFCILYRAYKGAQNN